jgi:hypothetical protein
MIAVFDGLPGSTVTTGSIVRNELVPTELRLYRAYTVGVGLLGAGVIAVFVVAPIERAVVSDRFGEIVFFVATLIAAAYVRHAGERDFRRMGRDE